MTGSAGQTGQTGPTGRTGATGAIGQTGPAQIIRYAISGSYSWCLLGTLTTTQNGNLFKLDVLSQNSYNAFCDFTQCKVIFSTANGSSCQSGADSTPFYGQASAYKTASFTDFIILQNSLTSYSFFYFVPVYPGNSFFTIQTNDAGDSFAYSGAAVTPSGCWIRPDTDYGINASMLGLGNVDNTSDVNKPVSTATQTALNSKANIASPTFTGTVTSTNLTASGTVTTANLTASGTVNIPNNALTIAKTSGLQAALDGKANINTYVIPTTANSWILLGSMTSLPQNGSVVVFQIFSNNNVGGNVVDELYATIRFSTSNGTAFVRNGANSTPFYGEASIIQSMNFAANAAFGIQQNSSTSYSFFLDTGPAPGVGFFTVQSQSAFTYSGTTSASGPTGCFVYPTLLYQQGIDSSGEATLVLDTIRSYYFRSTDASFRILNAATSALMTLNTSGSTLNSSFACGNLTCGSSLAMGATGSTSTLTFNAGGTNYNYLSVTSGNVFGVTANNTSILSCDGTTLNLPTDITSSTANVTKTFILETTNASGTPAFVMKCRGTVQSTISQTNAFLTYAAQSTNLAQRFTVFNGTSTITAMTISGSTGAITMGVSPLTVVSTTYTSDRNLKDNIEDASLTDCEAIFDAVEARTFSWRRDGKQSMGFIAQEVEAALPENGLFGDLINQATYQPTDEDEPMVIKTIDYSRMATVLWGVVKLLKGEVESLKARVATLEAAAT
jgi:Chaperone of endosialidase